MSRLDCLRNVRRLTTAWLAIIAVIPSFGSANDKGMAREISATNFEIAGITLGLSTDQDAERVFGPAPAVDTPDHEGARRCYVSAKGDGTVLELESWVGTLIRFRLESALCESKPSCAQAALVSNKLTTGAGLKLGLLRKQIVEILGPPTAIHGSRLTYERSFDRPLTAEEEKRLKEKGGPPWDVKSVHVDDKIEIVLSNSKVVSIDVLHNETD